MEFTRKYLAIASAILVILLSHCAPTLPQLTARQLSIRIANGSQTTTLALSKTHTPVGSAVVKSEYEARLGADKVGADVAQLLYSNHSKKEYTYRFWQSN